jgi:hypothetical protein
MINLVANENSSKMKGTLKLRGDIYQSLAQGKRLSYVLEGPIAMRQEERGTSGNRIVEFRSTLKVQTTYNWLKVAGKRVKTAPDEINCD